MRDWKAQAIAVLIDTSNRALEARDHSLYEASLKAIVALQSEGDQLTRDLSAYQMVMRELFASGQFA